MKCPNIYGIELGVGHWQAPLNEEELEGLLVPTITLRRELDEFEHQNIERAIRWSLRARIKKDDILTESFLRRVHEKMYGDVWSWAGKFRRTNKNIGVEWHQSPAQLKALLGDCNYWIDRNTYDPEEIAIRFKHRLVSIHCFPNGNGRHSRLMADIIINKIYSQPVFSWNGTREGYINAVKAADLNDLKALLTFARS